jgi:hypothetical protein
MSHASPVSAAVCSEKVKSSSTLNSHFLQGSVVRLAKLGGGVLAFAVGVVEFVCV